MTAIPYTVEPRPDTGVNNVTLGVWLFLASEVMLFGGLFSAYFMLRAGATAWPAPVHVPYAVVNTSLLFAGTVCFAIGARAARAGQVTAFRLATTAAIVLLLGFLAVKGLEYRADFAEGLYPRSSTRMALYFLLTGVHAVHVIGGVIALALIAMRIGPQTAEGLARLVNRLHGIGLYWYFVDTIWVILLVLLYAS